jgi:hypothetical protein
MEFFSDMELAGMVQQVGEAPEFQYVVAKILVYDVLGSTRQCRVSSGHQLNADLKANPEYGGRKAFRKFASSSD